VLTNARVFTGARPLPHDSAAQRPPRRRKTGSAPYPLGTTASTRRRAPKPPRTGRAQVIELRPKKRARGDSNTRPTGSKPLRRRFGRRGEMSISRRRTGAVLSSDLLFMITSVRWPASLATRASLARRLLDGVAVIIAGARSRRDRRRACKSENAGSNRCSFRGPAICNAVRDGGSPLGTFLARRFAASQVIGEVRRALPDPWRPITRPV